MRSFCFQFLFFIKLQCIQHKNVFAQLTKCLPIRAYTFWIACLFVRRLMVLCSFSFRYCIYLSNAKLVISSLQPKLKYQNRKRKQLILWEIHYLNCLLILVSLNTFIFSIKQMICNYLITDYNDFSIFYWIVKGNVYFSHVHKIILSMNQYSMMLQQWKCLPPLSHSNH